MDKLEELLKTRAQVEIELEKMRTPITILFSDIRGSTSFFEVEGDVEGLAMVHRHNNVLFPIIENNHGRVVKTIGDAIMASFDKPENALRAGIAMQQALERHNRERGPNQQIHIRIGIHNGLGLIKNGDVYGDVVNTASRVEHHSEPDQIFISEDLVQTAGALGVNVTSMGAAELKGKAETVQLYKLDWSGYVPKAPQPESANKKSKLFGILAAGAVLAVLAIGTSVWLMRPEPGAVEYASIGGDSKLETGGVTASEVGDLLLQDPTTKAILEKSGKPATREALLNGTLRGLRSEAPDEFITRAELAFVLEDLISLASGDASLATKYIGSESSPFVDVETSHPAFNAIMTATDRGFLQARTANHFAPTEPATPGEVQSALNQLAKTIQTQ